MLPFRSGLSYFPGTAGFFLILGLLGSVAIAADPAPSLKPTEAKTKANGSLANIPLPIGQEAKGLVLPDFDLNGHLRARFEAGVAKRIDAERIEFRGLKLTTYTPENTTDLSVDMPLSTLDLNTRVITSHDRSTVKRADFNIAGDTMQFDTVKRKGTLVGNVKMVITSQSQLPRKTGE